MQLLKHFATNQQNKEQCRWYTQDIILPVISKLTGDIHITVGIQNKHLYYRETFKNKTR